MIRYSISSNRFSTSGVRFSTDPIEHELKLLIDTTIASQTGLTVVTIPATGGPFDINHGNGDVDLAVSGSQVKDYGVGNGGEYLVKLTDTFGNITYDNVNDNLKLKEIKNWGTNEWSTMERAFYGCDNMDIIATDVPNTSLVSNFDQAFRACGAITFFPLMDTSNGTSFINFLNGSMLLISFPMIDVSSGLNFTSSWRNCSTLTTFPLLDFSAGTNINNTWRDCSGLTSFPLIPVSNASSLVSTWRGCSTLTTFPLIDTSSVSNSNSTWRDCTGLTSFPTIDLSSMTNGADMFTGSDIGVTSWSNLLIATEANNAASGITWGGGDAMYNAAGKVARDLLTARGWVITDGGLAP